MNEIVKKLPDFQEPKTLEEAKIRIINLGRSMGEHAYILGKNLIWVKSQLKHGEFLDWIEINLWFKKSTAENFINFSIKCDEANRLLEEPHYLEKTKIPKFGNLETPELPEGKYRVIYSDPPWFYNAPQHTTEEQETVLETHYSTMNLEQIQAIPVKDIAHVNSVLFLWITSPLIFQPEEVINAWGFEYKASFVWDKIKHNVGYYNSVRHELLLICTRGSCLPDSQKLYDSVVSIERTKHSQKPAYFRELIDKMYVPPKGRNDRIEFFARDFDGKLQKKYPHWDFWGLEA